MSKCVSSKYRDLRWLKAGILSAWSVSNKTCLVINTTECFTCLFVALTINRLASTLIWCQPVYKRLEVLIKVNNRFKLLRRLNRDNILTKLQSEADCYTWRNEQFLTWWPDARSNSHTLIWSRTFIPDHKALFSDDQLIVKSFSTVFCWPLCIPLSFHSWKLAQIIIRGVLWKFHLNVW